MDRTNGLTEGFRDAGGWGVREKKRQKEEAPAIPAELPPDL